MAEEKFTQEVIEEMLDDPKMRKTLKNLDILDICEFGRRPSITVGGKEEYTEIKDYTSKKDIIKTEQENIVIDETVEKKATLLQKVACNIEQVMYATSIIYRGEEIEEEVYNEKLLDYYRLCSKEENFYLTLDEEYLKRDLLEFLSSAKVSYAKEGNRQSVHSKCSPGVYIIKENNGLYKIGMSSTSIKDRVDILRTSTPYELVIVDLFNCESKDKCLELEKELHRYYSSFRRRGEWFELKELQIEEISYYFDVLYLLDTFLAPGYVLGGFSGKGLTLQPIRIQGFYNNLPFQGIVQEYLEKERFYIIKKASSDVNIIREIVGSFLLKNPQSKRTLYKIIDTIEP